MGVDQGRTGQILYKEGDTMICKQGFGSSLPTPYRGRDKVRASGLSNTIKDESKGGQRRKDNRINLSFKPGKGIYRFLVILKEESMAGTLE